MTPTEWESLTVGDVLIYVGNEQYTDYQDTICEVVGFSPRHSPKLSIITPGKQGHPLWGTGIKTTSSFLVADAFKFEFYKSSPQTLENRISNKIKALDTKWANKQKEKGNNYALFLLRL